VIAKDKNAPPQLWSRAEVKCVSKNLSTVRTRFANILGKRIFSQCDNLYMGMEIRLLFGRNTIFTVGNANEGYRCPTGLYVLQKKTMDL